MLASVRSWAVKKRLTFGALIRLAVKPSLAIASGGGVPAVLAFSELLGKGLNYLVGEDSAEICEPSGNAEERFGKMAEACGDLIERLSQRQEMVNIAEKVDAFEEQLALILEHDAEMRGRFDAMTGEVRHQAMSLMNIETKLEEIAHVVLKLPVALEEFKRLLSNAHGREELERLRGLSREAAELLADAERLFLKGDRAAGMTKMRQLHERFGLSDATIAHEYGLHQIGSEQLKEAEITLSDLPAGDAPLAVSVKQTLGENTTFDRAGEAGVWRSLPRDFEIGGKYRIEKEIGRGGMASVYETLGIDDLNEGQRFALKIPAPGVIPTKEAIKRFAQEIEIARKLSDGSPKEIVRTEGYERFIDPHTNAPSYAMVMEFVEGESLARMIARRKVEKQPLSREEIVRVMECVCAALTLAHGLAKRIIHRDTKPGNVMICGDGSAKLMDFGIARMMAELTRQTRTGAAVGTLAYMSPEMHERGGVVDPQTDVFQLGCLLHEMMTLSPTGDLGSRPDLPEGWLRLIMEAKSPAPKLRPKSVTAFYESLVNAELALDQLDTANERQRGSVEEQAAEQLSYDRSEGGLAAAKLDHTKLRRMRPGEVITNSLGIKFAFIPAGKFVMGSNLADDEKPHEVTISRPFFMALTPLTNLQWKQIMRSEPPSNRKDDMHPVECVTWDEAVACAANMRGIDGLHWAGFTPSFDLPSEAEWEYACRAGTTTTFSFGKNESALRLHAWFEGNSGSATNAVSCKFANPWGLFDMHGNVWEWCKDWYDASYYADSPKTDPVCANGEKTSRVLRGGSWRNIAEYCRSAYRKRGSPASRNISYGFRLVVRLD